MDASAPTHAREITAVARERLECGLKKYRGDFVKKNTFSKST